MALQLKKRIRLLNENGTPFIEFYICVNNIEDKNSRLQYVLMMDEDINSNLILDKYRIIYNKESKVKIDELSSIHGEYTGLLDSIENPEPIL